MAESGPPPIVFILLLLVLVGGGWFFFFNKPASQPVTLDTIALAVGINNPFKGGLTSAQVQDIFKGNAQDWSNVGGPAGPIKVINRPEVSGTHQTFKEQVLSGANFGTGPNITKLDRDATTPLLQALGNNGIGYATFAQVVNQKTVRVPSTVRPRMLVTILTSGSCTTPTKTLLAKQLRIS
jgi:ABC-type phosphate transport system substrate-binding protein